MWLTAKLDVSGSGGDVRRRVKVGSPHETVLGGGFFLTRRLSFWGSPAAFATILAFWMACSGACTTTVPLVS